MLSEQEQIRRESLKKIINYVINPYTAKEFKFSHYSKQILENYIEGWTKNTEKTYIKKFALLHFWL